MKLSILVPQYKEDETIIKPLLDSIALQQGVDLNEIEVIIVNDGSDVKLRKKFLSQYNYDIDYYISEHAGVSATRNKCLDHAVGDFVMFCDADDMFYNACSLKIIFDEIDNFEFDTLSSDFIEEQHNKETGEIRFLVRDDGGATFVHGKVHRRQYLKDKNIRWNEKLKVNEDSFFNCLCRCCADKVRHAKTPFYLWRWRDDSVCRRDKNHNLKTFVNLIDSHEAMLEEFINRRMPSECEYYMTSILFQTYFTVNEESFIKNPKYKEKTELRIAKLYKKYEDFYRNVDEEVKKDMYIQLRNTAFNNGVFFETETFDDWLTRISGSKVRNGQIQ